MSCHRWMWEGLTWCISGVWFIFPRCGNLPNRVMHPPWLPKHLCEVGRCTIGGHIMHPQAWLRTQSWIRPGQLLLSRSLVSCIPSDRWENEIKRIFFKPFNWNMAKLDLLTTFYDFHSQNTVLPILVTTVLKQKMTGKHGFVTHGTDSGLNNVLQYMRFVSSSVIIAYHWSWNQDCWEKYQ